MPCWDTAAEIEDLEGLIARLRGGVTASGGIDVAPETLTQAADVIERLRRKVSDYAMDDLARINQELGLDN